MKKIFFTFVILLFLAFSATTNAQIKIDGVFFDWDTAHQLDIDTTAELTFENGDPDTPNPSNPSYFADLDVDDLYATDDADFVYIRIKMNSISNIMNIANDTSYHGGAAIAAYISVDPGDADTTGLTWGWWGSGYDYFVQVYPVDTVAEANTRYEQFIWEHKQTGTSWDFEVKDSLVGVKAAWNGSNNDVEMAIPKSLLLNPKHLANFTTPEKIEIMIYAGENLGPWRADYASMPGVAGYEFTLTEPGPITVDGVFFDWETTTQLDVAPNVEEMTFENGDPDTPNPSNTSYFADLDVEDVFATSDDNNVYVRVKMNSIANVMNIASDTSYHGGAAIAAYISVDPGEGDTTGLTWGWWGNGYDYFVQVYPADTTFQDSTGFAQAIWEHKQTGNSWDYEVASNTQGSNVAWNFSNNDVEFSIPKSILLNPKYLTNFVTPTEIAVMIYAGENLGPWRADYASETGVAGYKVKIDNTTDVKENEATQIPTEYTLMQNYPNPFNPTTNIQFSIPSSNFVKIKVYNLLGQEIATLVNQNLSAGNYTTNFSAENLASGIYVYSLEVGSNVISKKMLVMK
ncbi:MAG: T9SS type A sorting domain-containing protein [Ignavibacteriae bacterium]|nr:T9SS type A sorting domain-containing protein [Ignavibacteriota bacterium]